MNLSKSIPKTVITISLLTGFMLTSTAHATSVPINIPEPGTLALASIGLLGMIAGRKWKKKSSS